MVKKIITSLDKTNIVIDLSREENNIVGDLKPVKRDEHGNFLDGLKKEKNGFPIAHYIGANYNFEGKDQIIQTALGLAGYFAVAHKDFNDFYGSLKGAENDYLKFNSLDKRLEREFDAFNEATSKDVIICPLDSYYKIPKDKQLDIEKIENGELILDSIELAKRIDKKGLKNKINLIVYDSLEDIGYLKWREEENCLDECIEENVKYSNNIRQIEEKYGLEFIEKIDLPYPFQLYESLREKNSDMFLREN